MKKIVCYGDSNTFGFNPKDGSQYGENVRWTSILKNNLKEQYEVINEGTCDRTGFKDNPKGFMFSAHKHFPKYIEKSQTIDVLILWIGTNDLQFQYDISLDEIKNGLENLIKIAQSKTKRIIIIPPVILSDNILDGYFRCQFDEISIEKSKKIEKIYRELANLYNLEFFDVNEFTKPSELDGLHYDINSHKIIADKLTLFFEFQQLK